jgi:PAS domain S-box-containing protein
LLAGLVGSLLLSGLLAMAVEQQNTVIATERFGIVAERFAEQLKQRLHTYQYGLLEARSAVIAGGEDAITYEDFHRFSRSRDIAVEFPGTRGFGFIRPVKSRDRDEFTARARREGQVGFTIKQFTPHQNDLYVIEYVEPREVNRRGIGLDIASEVNRKAAADAAVARGEATITAPITLSQSSDGKRPRGFLILLPVFRSGAPVTTDQQRWDALVGWTHTVVIMNEIFAKFESINSDFGFSLSDGDEPPFYATGVPADSHSTVPVHDRSIDVYGRTWRISLWAQPQFAAALALRSPWSAFAVSLAICLLVIALIGLQLFYSARRREQNMERWRLAAIVEGARDAIVAKSLDGTVIGWNRAAELLFGYSAEQAIGKKASSLIVPEHLRDEEHRLLVRIRDGEPATHLRTQRKKCNGDLVDVAVSVSPIRADDGALIGIATAARDITELVQAEKEIHNLNASLERQVAERTAQLNETLTLQTAILKRAAYAVVATDPAGTITLFNAAAELMLGYRAEDMIGRATPILYHDSRELEQNAEALRAQGVAVESGLDVFRARLARNDPDTAVWTHIAKNGERIQARVTLSTLRTEDGVNLGILAISVDLTNQIKYEDELKAARARAEQAGAAKADFLANMSHEIRTPLNGIIGYADLALEDETLAPATRRQVARIFEASESLRVIIDDILDFSKIEACGVQLESKPLYISELIDNCASIIQPKAEEKGLKLVATVSDTPPVLIGDAPRLRQVLLNLMNNAVKFTASGSVELVVASLSRSADMVRLRISVTDTGIGISPEAQKVVFKRFSQADETISRKFGGTGLGLAISQRIVQAMQSELKIDSEPGKGSCFYFEVELRIADQIDIENSEAPVQGGRSLKILVVDDVEMNRDLCKTMLSRTGHQVDLADSGSSAIAMTSARDYDLILMDVQMGEMDGLEATRRIRASGGGPGATPIVALTANVMPEQVKRYKAAGMDDHLGKPIHRGRLLACVAKWADLGSRRQAALQPGPRAEPSPGEFRVCDPAALEDLRMFASDQDIAGFAGLLRDAIASIEAQWPRAPGPNAAPCDDPREELGRIAHKTVSLAGQLGFVHLAEACRRMENACLSNSAVPEALDHLHAAITETAPAIEALLAAA